MNSAENKVVFITGASRRIGASIASLFHSHNMNVVLHCHHSLAEAHKLNDLFNQIRPDSSRVLEADLAQADELQPLIDKVLACWGRLDCVINNAARFYPTPILEATELMWDDLLLSNLKAPYFLAKAAVPHLQKTKGCIINITDIYAMQPLNYYSIYCITKAGLVMLTLALAKELGPEIRVNAISPGVILWPEGQNTFSAATKEALMQHTALKRSGNPVDIAKAAWFLAMDSEYVTGQVLSVDGGQQLF